MRSSLIIGLLAGVGLVSSSALVPGRGFDRIISIWLENQVSHSQVTSSHGPPFVLIINAHDVGE